MRGIEDPIYAMRYEIYTDEDGWRWQLVDDTENVVISAAHPLTHDQCRTVVHLVRMTLDAPVAVTQRPQFGGISSAQPGSSN